MSTPDIRVEQGHAEPEAVAAITAVLLARAAAPPAGTAPAHRGRANAGWRRPERDEGAASTPVPLARAAARPAGTAPAHRGRAKAGWRRLEREGGFRAPHSWR